MKCEIIIDSALEEKIVIYAKENSVLIEDIKQMVEKSSIGLVGYNEKEMVTLNPLDIYCVTIIDNRVFAICENEKLQLKERLYSLEERLPETFIKINKSTLANIQKIERFDASISGTLKILFKNGYVAYVSRRQLITIKERLGI